VLKLPDPGSAQVACAGDLVERHRLCAAEAKAHLKHEAVALGQVLEGTPKPANIRAQIRIGLKRGIGAFVAHKVTEHRTRIVAQWLVERGDRGRRAPQLLHAGDRETGAGRELRRRRWAARFTDELELRLAQARDSARHADGNPNWARGFGESPADGFADPPGRIGREATTAAIVELLGRPNQADAALLDQVEQRRSARWVSLRDRDDEAEVGLNKSLLGSQIASLDPPRERPLLISSQERVPTGFPHQSSQAVELDVLTLQRCCT
jgi:hypothetical protein